MNRFRCVAALALALALLPGCSLLGARTACPVSGGGDACRCDDCNGSCGGAGIVCSAAQQSCALVHVLFSKRWEGGYPYGTLHGWRGSWCGCCGDGGLDTTHPTSIPPHLADAPR